MVGDSQLPDNTAVQNSRPVSSIYFGAGPGNCLNVWLCIYKISWDAKVIFISMVFNLLLKWRT